MIRYGPNEPGEERTVMTVAFTLDGDSFVGIAGRPDFTFSQAVSVQVDVDAPKKWTTTGTRSSTAARRASSVGLKDRFGFSWQITPRASLDYISGEDRAAASRVTQAMLGMKKLDVAALHAAAQG